MTEAGQPGDATRTGARSGIASALAVAFVSGLVRVLLSDRRGFWLDELYTLRAAEAPLGELVRERIAAGHSPLPFLYAKLGLLLGDGEVACRATSALAIAVATFAVLRLAARIESTPDPRAPAGPAPGGEPAARLALEGTAPRVESPKGNVPIVLSGLCLLHPYWTTIGTEFRYMAPLVALAAVATLLAYDHAGAGSVDPGRRRAVAVAYAAVCAALAWTHGSAQFVLAGLVAFGILEARAGGRPRGETLRLIAPPLIGFLSSLPLLYLLRGGDGSGPGSRAAPALDDVLKEYPQVVFGDFAIWPDGIWPNASGIPTALLLVPGIAVFWFGIAVARRSFLRSGRGTAWRLLGGSMLGSTLAIWLVAALRDGSVQGPVRYIAALSVPATLLLAEAWRAPLPRTRLALRGGVTALLGRYALRGGLKAILLRNVLCGGLIAIFVQLAFRSGLIAIVARIAFRGGLVALLVVQAAGAALECGDGHREAIAWVRAAHDGASPVLLVSGEMNRFALLRAGFDHPELTRELSKRKPSLEETVAEMRAIFAAIPSSDSGAGSVGGTGPGGDLGLALIYHGRAPVTEAARLLHDEGFFVETREWTLGKTRMLALARTPEAAARLAAIADPPARSGPYRKGD